MIDAVRVFSEAVYSLQNIETTPIDCNSNDDDFQHGYTLINKIRTVRFSKQQQCKRINFLLVRVSTMDLQVW